MRYTLDERHEKILELTRLHGTIRVTDLAQQLGMSTVTVRRDVEALAVAGQLERTRGAVSWPGAPQGVPSLVHQAGAETRPVDRLDGQGVILGLVVPEAQEYFAEIVRGVRDAVHEAGAHLVLGFSGYIREQDEEQSRRLLEAGAAGLLLSPGWLHDGSEQQDSRLDFGVPTVLLERRAVAGTEATEFDSVCSDHVAGAGLAVRHLASLGRGGMVLVVGGSSTAAAMRSGYEAALRVAGLAPVVPPIELYTGKLDPACLQRAAARLAEAVDAGTVDAAVVLSDTDAMIILQTLRAIAPHIEVPRDLALVVYGDEVAALSDLPLTAVAPPKYEVGQEAARLLLRRVREQQVNGGQRGARRHLALVPELRVRRSSGGAIHQKVARQD